MKNKNKFFTLLFSCYPGGGHMYLGFMKQGLQLMILFSAIFAIATISYIFQPIAFALPILVAYSIFDAGNKRSNMIEPDDSDLELFKWLNIRNTGSLKEVNYYKTGAYILIIMGVYMLFDNVAVNIIRSVIQSLFSAMDLSTYYIERVIKSSILGIIFIIGGIKLLGQMKKVNSTEKDDDNV